MATAVATPSINSNVASFITQKKQMLINGKWVGFASPASAPASYNPATGEVLANIAEGDREDINRAVKAARAAFETGKWSKTSPAARARMMWKLADLLEEHLEEFRANRIARQRQASRRRAGRRRSSRHRKSSLLRRMGHQNRRQHDSVDRRPAEQIPRLHAP